jgi:hypothetical protein
LLAAVSLALSSVALAAGTKDYQVTGPILEVTDSMIAVQKGKDRWEIARDANTKASGEMKVGDKVTSLHDDGYEHRGKRREGRCKGRAEEGIVIKLNRIAGRRERAPAIFAL